MDKTVEVLIEYDRIRGPQGALAVREGQAEQRADINQSIQSAVGIINELSEKLLPLQKARVALEAEVGPLKYIAELIYGEEAKSNLDQAVRAVIILIIFVFDPLAVLLLIAANQSIAEVKRHKRVKEVIEEVDNDIEVEVEGPKGNYKMKRPKEWLMKNKGKLIVDKDNVSKL